MTKDEALKLALEALEQLTKVMLKTRDELAERGGRPVTNKYHQMLWDASFAAYTDHAIPTSIAIREALAQPEREPVACVGTNGELMWLNKPKVIYSKPIPLYTTPPHRKPLTDEEIDKLPWEPHESNPMTFAEGLRYFARAIEAAHGIKE